MHSSIMGVRRKVNAPRVHQILSRFKKLTLDCTCLPLNYINPLNASVALI